VILQPVDPPLVFAGMVQEIEALDYQDLWCTDSSLHARNPYAYLTLAAGHSRRLRLGTAVTNPLTRHPAVTAVAASTVDEISGGRFTLGIGAGDRPLLALGLRPSTLDQLECSIATMRALWKGDTVDVAADTFTVAEGYLRFGARPDLPVFISASGPRTLELAGRVADGVLVLAGLFDEAVRWAIGCIDRGAEAAGRPRPHVAVCAYGAVDDDSEYALGAARSIAAWFPQTAPVICGLAGLPDHLVEAARANYRGGEFQEAGGAAAVLPDSFVQQVALAGDRSQAEATVRTVLDAGADSVQLFPLGARRMDTVRAFAESWDRAVGVAP
jgi:5,10-methylenetetrahydromethanopterin reductase